MIEENRIKFEQVIEACEKDIASLRAARANPSLVENILIDAYGTKTPLIQLATLSTPDARTLVIQPWDKSIVKEIETSITNSDIGINPVNEGEIIRLVIPQLTEERRKELVRSLGKKIEQYRISLRNIRDEIREQITEAQKNKEITEDDKYKFFSDLDNMTTEYNKKIKEISDKKENEIITI